MLIFWSLVRNSVVLAVYLLFSVACFLTVHEHSRGGYFIPASCGICKTRLSFQAVPRKCRIRRTRRL
ncbi:MAG: hypothetical protein EGP89_02245 [Ruminococcaceae bacterium]|nr:hypothetical protein [Oscillospiraceae bacterium]